MTEQETFEAWYMGVESKSSLNKSKEGFYVYAPARVAFGVWQAAKEDSTTHIDATKFQELLDVMVADKTAEIAELKAQRVRENSEYYAMYELNHDSLTTITQLQAENLKLRKLLYDAAFEMVSEGFSEWHKAVENLAETPAHSLQEHDNEVIERCALVCDACKVYHKSFDAGLCSDAIRGLKGTP